MKAQSVLPLVIVVMVCVGVTIGQEQNSADINNDGRVDFLDFAIMAENWLWSAVPPDMAFIPGGEFLMGDHFDEGRPNEKPIHAVMVDSFYISIYETTNEQYCNFLNSAKSSGEILVYNGMVYSLINSNIWYYFDTNSYDEDSQIEYSGGVFSVRTKSGRNMSNDPVLEVSWYGAVAYCNWRSQQEGYEDCYNLATWECDFSKHGYRLPTEAEWEYAARGGEHDPYYRYPWGDTISHSQANYESINWAYGDVSPTRGHHPLYDDGIYPYTAPVDSFQPNGYGLYNMAGNVWDWCNDWRDDSYYSISPYDNPKGPISGTKRVLRGGSWFSDGAQRLRVARRGDWFDLPMQRDAFYGFRVVLDLN